MVSELLARAPKSAVPITPLTKDHLGAWMKGQSAPWRNWVASTSFEAAPGSFSLLPGSDGALAHVLLGVEAEPDLWSYAGLPAALPPGAYRIEVPLPPRDGEQAALGWLLGSYRFARYKKAERERPRLVCPKGADRKRVAASAEAVYLVRDLITTPANDMGPKELASAARVLARQHKARVSVVVGDALLK